MASKIRIRELTPVEEDRADPDTGMSAREYDEFQVTAVKKAANPDWGFYGYGGQDTGVLLTLYRDEETGLITGDVAKFEEWINAR